MTETADNDNSALAEHAPQVRIRSIFARFWPDTRPFRGRMLHVAETPVAIITQALRFSSVARSSVFDPFCGSGSSLMAAEQLDRVCHAIEIEPRYCQVIIDRWEAFTGQQAVKVGEAIRA